MRLLGKGKSLRVHEKDLLHLAAIAKAHQDPRVQAVGQACWERNAALKATRKTLDDAEDLLVIAVALVAAKDVVRDATLVSMVRFADHLGGGDRARIFNMAPSAIARLGYDSETAEIDSALTRVRQLATDHPLRNEYEARLAADNEAFQAASKSASETEQKLVAARFAVLTAKVESDRFRETQYGVLVSLVGKAQAETMFKKWSRSEVAEDEETVEPTTPTPATPLPTK
jgi:hypothetical protein